MRRVFKTRFFARWLRKTDLDDAALCRAVSEMERGLIDADLGGGVFKKRVALPGRGKSGSARTLVATHRGDRWFFVFGFEKNIRANVSAKETGGVAGPRHGSVEALFGRTRPPSRERRFSGDLP